MQLFKALSLLRLTLVACPRVKCGRVNYCQYDHIFAKDTCVRTTVVQWEPKGKSGTGMTLCRAARGNYTSKTGFFNTETNRWNHHNTIGGKATKSVKGPSKDEVQNPLPICAFHARPRSSRMGLHSIGFISLLRW